MKFFYHKKCPGAEQYRPQRRWPLSDEWSGGGYERRCLPQLCWPLSDECSGGGYEPDYKVRDIGGCTGRSVEIFQNPTTAANALQTRVPQQ